MKTELRIANNFELPLDAVTQTFAILAAKGSGKSYTASVMAEEMLSAGQQIIAVDPTGSWWGLRSKFKIVVFGGDHSMIPLEESAGEVIAQAAVENKFSAVLDLSLFRKAQMIRFMAAFSETLYRLNRDPLHLFVDEADMMAPQARNYGGQENHMLGAMEDIVRRGRKRGIGCTLITQRPSVLNKNVLTQAGTLVAMRMTHPRDIGAIKEWIDVHADPKEAKVMIDSLPSLTVGTAWWWSPGWGNFFKCIITRKRETFDSGATPKPGQQELKPKHLVEIDLDALGEKIKATVERVKANDPKALQVELAKLRRQVEQQAAVIKSLEARPQQTGLDPKQIKRAISQGSADGFNEAQEAHERFLKPIIADIERIRTALMQRLGVKKYPEESWYKKPMSQMSDEERVALRKFQEPLYDTATITINGKLPIGEAKLLRALIQFSDGLWREQLTVLTGYKRSSRDAYISRLAEKGYIGLDASKKIHVSAAGRGALPDAQPLPTGKELRDYWMAKLPVGERAILDILIKRYPNSVTRDELSDITQYKRSSRDAYLSRLRAKELIEDDGYIKASENLF